MANLAHIAPSARKQGFRAQVATLTPGIAVIRGTAADQVTLSGAGPARIVGTLDIDENLPAIGDTVPVNLAAAGDTTYVQSGAAFAVDALLSVNASGQFITATTAQKVLARALAAAAAAGELVPAIFADADLSAP